MSKEDFSRGHDKSRELCFDENEFLKESFSVDTFLREHKNKASLEVMRDDLGTHLKTLRLSMIELINKDYEDFVNLSKDLIGLDNRIKKIQAPLELIKAEVAGVKNDLDEAISSFKNSLQQHKEITDKKRSLIHLNQVIICINKLKSILNSLKKNENNYSLELIERAAMEYNHLQFSVSKCDRDMNNSQRKEAEEIRNTLMSILNNKFLVCLKSKITTDLVKCFKIYAGLDRIQDLESLVRYEVIAPKLTEIITEQALQTEPDGISQIYDKILSFFEKELADLLLVTTHKDTFPQLKNHNFLISSFWPEFEKRISLPVLFAPGNAQLFHTRFTKSRNFLRKLELLCGYHSSIFKFRENDLFQQFKQKWNLPVYYKIRFQEIGGQFEKCLSESNFGKPVVSDSDSSSSSSYHLKPSFTALALVKKCWRDDVYLPELSHLFWKLSLQILSRYTVWIGEILNKNSEFHEKRKIELGTLQTSFGLDNFQVQCRLDFLVCLYSDTNKLLEDVENFLNSCKFLIPNGEAVKDELSLSLEESLKSIKDTLPKITDSIVNIMVSESAVHLRQVSQIPRLFRRTNRKSSAEPCEYVGQVLSFPLRFREWKKDLSSNVSKSLFTSVFDELTTQFYWAVHDVLMNAQKTEESLRKLKKKKDNAPGKNSSSSGDEEIRQQLVIDVHSFSDEIESFKVPKENLTMLKQLVELVETARNKTEKH